MARVERVGERGGRGGGSERLHDTSDREGQLSGGGEELGFWLCLWVREEGGWVQGRGWAWARLLGGRAEAERADGAG